MSIFISAGHNKFPDIRTGKPADPGAQGCGEKEADLTVIQRDLVIAELARLGAKNIHHDGDDESLATYLKRIQTGDGSTTLEVHFDSAPSAQATGTTSIVGNDADRLDKAFARELVDSTASILGIRNRGVITESESHRGSLGLMREQGIVSLLEIGFITNCNDIAAWQAKKELLATAIARLLIKYDNLIS